MWYKIPEKYHTIDAHSHLLRGENGKLSLKHVENLLVFNCKSNK